MEKVVNNCVFIDAGDMDLYHMKKVLSNGTEIYLATDLGFSGAEAIRRSGKTTTELLKIKYENPDPRTNPFIMADKIFNPTPIPKECIVFFDFDAKEWCERNDMKIKKDGSYIYIMPYRFLSILIKDDKNIMLNGKVLVSRIENQNNTDNEIIILPYKPKTDISEAHWCTVENVNTDEIYSGHWKNYDYIEWNRTKANVLKVGYKVLVKKYGSYNLHGLIDEGSDELKEKYVVKREKIIAYKENDKAISKPFSEYVKVELLETPVEKTERFVYDREKKLMVKIIPEKRYVGKVLDIGGAVYEVDKGDIIEFTQKVAINEDDGLKENGIVYTHQDWILFLK